MLGSPAGPGGPAQRSGLWPLAPAPAPSATGFTADGFSKYGIYSLLPGGQTFGSALYSHSSIGRFTGSIQPTSGASFHTGHKVSDSLFTTAGYTFGAPTPPPGSPYSPVPVAQLELLTKGFNSNIIIQQQHQQQLQLPDYSLSPKKASRCEEKCCGRASKASRDCCQSPAKMAKYLDSPGGGCSRTNPLEWSSVNVKKEPMGCASLTTTSTGSVPCQVAEITTSEPPAVVKVEVTSPTQKTTPVVSADVQITAMPPVVTANGNIPVGIAVARQRIQHHEIVSSPSLQPTGLLATVSSAQIKEFARISEFDGGMAASAVASGGGIGGGPLLHDERVSGIGGVGGFSAGGWPMGGAQAHGSALAAPTLWQYPAPLPVEPIVPMPMPMPPVGFQLVRDHNTGGLLLIPTTGVEQVQQTVVWPSYHQPSSHVLLPPLPPPPLQLLSSGSSDYLQTSTTLHQHTQTHSTRLVAVTTDSKRKLPLPIPATTLIKIETDATLDSTKTLQAVSTIANNTGTVFTDQNMTPLVTTHVIYQHPTNLILSQTPAPETTTCRSQATSPVACLTPPPEIATIQEEETTVQDASNQTDSPECSEDDIAQEATITEIEEEKSPQEESPDEVQNDALVNVPEPAPEEESVEQEKTEVSKEVEEPKPDISGLELLSNSIVEFENCRKLDTEIKEEPMKAQEQPDVLESMAQMSITEKESKVPSDDLGGLNLLCALAEQRIMEEVSEKAERKRQKRKSKKHSDEPRHKKSKRSDRDRNRDRDVKKSDNSVKPCTCQDDSYKTYKTKESEEEVRKFLASKSQSMCCKGDWPCMNEMELDMRMRLADLQRKYREKQRELSKLKPKKHDKHDKKNRSRKKSMNSDRSTPPPQLDKMDTPVRTNKSQELLSPPTLCPYGSQESDETPEAPHTPAVDCSNPAPPRKSSKKRKVGRPKKLLSSSGLQTVTETIVAKKPKKGGLVGYLLAAKEKLIQNGYSDGPPRFVDDSAKKKSSKIGPKLKAEATVKSFSEEEEEEVTEPEVEEEEVEQEVAEKPVEETPQVIELVEEEQPKVVEEEESAKVDTRCSLTTERLGEDKLRVLTAMGGLFYAGRLNAVEPPDVYSITLDGERGNRPHIMSREEILRDAIVEVSPSSTEELSPGTRLCAYWSQQYRCLYPGSVAEPETQDGVVDSKFVSVEFDDGDSGTIAIEDIRLLPSDFPIIEYDPNPLLSLSKRRRRISTTDERRSNPGPKSPSPVAEPAPPPAVPAPEVEKENKTGNAPDDVQRERKRLKKKKREKLKQKLEHDDKRKKKKHKCADAENCKHRKHHKKHRKHKKHHHAKENVDEEKSSGDTSAEQVEQNEDTESSGDAAEDEVTYPEYRIIANPEDEVTMDDIVEANSRKDNKRIRDRQESCESRSKMSAFLPAKQLWSWSGRGYKRSKAKGRSRKMFYKAIQRGNETIQAGDAAVFKSTGRPDRPYIGKIESMWEACGTMVVRIKWFYHPEETVGCPLNLKYPGALFESPHIDENDVQTISHKCEVLPLREYTDRLGSDPKSYTAIYDNNDVYYLAGYYDPTTTSLKMEPNIPFNSIE